MKNKLRTVIIGFGKIAQGNAFDAVMAKTMRYASHAQVLKDHDGFLWDSVVDPSENACSDAQNKWDIPYIAKSIDQLHDLSSIDVAVLATHPEDRLECLKYMPNLKGVLVEKPLGLDLAASDEFIQYCVKRKLPVQVNITRRADPFTLSLAQGKLAELIGRTQIVHGVYGNGVLNNGTHMVDLVRLLWGEIQSVQVIPNTESFVEGPLTGDMNLPFVLKLKSGMSVIMQPVMFANYRENGLDIWGERGRLEYMHGGLTLIHYSVGQNRAISTDKEVVIDSPSILPSTLGMAFWEMYNNLAKVIRGEQQLLSPATSAFETAKAIEAIFQSARNNCVGVNIQDVKLEAAIST